MSDYEKGHAQGYISAKAEIDRLKAELECYKIQFEKDYNETAEAAIMRLSCELLEANKQKSDWHSMYQETYDQLAEANGKLVGWPNLFDENMRLATANDALRDELAEARADVDRLIKDTVKIHDEAWELGRQEAAREAIEEMRRVYPKSGCYQVLQAYFKRISNWRSDMSDNYTGQTSFAEMFEYYLKRNVTNEREYNERAMLRWVNQQLQQAQTELASYDMV